MCSFLITITEERGSGVDKTIEAIELYQLPAPNFMKGERFLRVVLYAHRALKFMDKNDKIRACFQHCALKYVSGEFMTNTSLRERFNVSERNYSAVSRIIADTIEAGLIKDHDAANKSKKFAKYIPFWA